MKAELKKDITAVLDLLAERDPAWAHAKMVPKFKVLYQGWRVKELQRNVHSHGFYSLALRRNWLPIDDWKRFRDYALE